MRRDQKGAVGKALGGWQLSASGFIYGARPYQPVQTSNSNIFCNNLPRFGVLCTPHSGNPNAPETQVGIIAAFPGPGFNLFSFNDLNTGACDLTLGGSVPDCTPISFDSVRWIVNNTASLNACFPLFGANKHNVRGDNTRVVNMGVYKNTYVGSENQVNIQFRFQMVNVFNHRNFGRANNVIENSAFGIFADFVTSNDSAGRIGVFGLRVIF